MIEPLRETTNLRWISVQEQEGGQRTGSESEAQGNETLSKKCLKRAKKSEGQERIKRWELVAWDRWAYLIPKRMCSEFCR